MNNKVSQLPSPVRCVAMSLLFFVYTGTLPLFAQNYPDNYDPSFSADALPYLVISDKDDAVVRLDEQFFEVRDIGKATLTVHRAITVLNEGARDEGEFYVFYDKLRKVKKFEGFIRDANGKVIRKLGKGDIQDRSLIDEYSLYQDTRLRFGRLYHNEYPYTVEYRYVLEFNGLINWPGWAPFSRENPLEYGRYEVSVPKDMPVRYKVENMDLAPAITEEKWRKTYRWEVSYLHVFKEPLLAEANAGSITPPANEVTVHVAPEAFEIEGSRGDMRSWSTFGSWYYDLSRGRNVLPATVREQMQSIASEVEDPVERVKRVYQEFQSSTRYVSVQLGLGGWQPYDAMYVAENGYGDCKALTNYLQALLAQAGVNSYPALIYSGRGVPDILDDFPSNQFNHVVLMVPMAADTLWLEATDQSAPFNHLGAANEDRFALAIRSDGGELVRTPLTASSQNRRMRTSTVQLTASGNASAESSARYTGNRQDYIRYNIVQASGRDQMEWLRNDIDIPSFDIASADFSEVEGRQDEINIPFTLDLPRYASKSGKRLFVPTNLFRTSVWIPQGEDIPADPVKLSYAYTDNEEVHFELPQGYTIEAIPGDVEIETPFGIYRATHTQPEERQLVYERHLEFKTRVIQPAMYGEYRDFLKKVARADRAQVVLVAEP